MIDCTSPQKKLSVLWMCGIGFPMYLISLNWGSKFKSDKIKKLDSKELKISDLVIFLRDN